VQQNEKEMRRIGHGVSPDGGADFSGLPKGHQRRTPVKMDYFVSATLWLFFNAGVCWYWLAFPGVNVIFTNGYPQFGTPAEVNGQMVLPAHFKTARYGWDWWMFMLVVIASQMPLFLLSIAVLNNSMKPIARMHQMVSTVCMLLALFAFVVLTVRILMRCRNTYSGGNSACNDLSIWCCVYFPSEWCPNSTPCTPAKTHSDLEWTSAYFQTWLFSLCFLVFCGINAKININFIEYGILR
jgi:hypothetical protein